LKAVDSPNAVKTILFLSTNEKEGKTVMTCNIARKLIEQGKKVLVLNYSKDKEPLKNKGKHHLINSLLGYPDSRIDTDNYFFEDASSCLASSAYLSYNIDEQFYETGDYKDILEQNDLEPTFDPDYVFIELPSLIYHNYPTDLVSKADMSVLVSRSNRLWTEADQSVLNGLVRLTNSRISFIINGVEIKEVEAVLGDLPKNRTHLRRKIKNMFQFQFFSKNHI
jgi:succinoglycan biosynthesis transport protein ExoP